MAVAIVPKVITGKSYYRDVDVSIDQIAIQGLVRSTSGVADLYIDALTTVLTIGGGASNTTTLIRAAAAGTVNVGENTVVQTVNVGSGNGGSTTVVRAGTAGISLQTAGAEKWSINSTGHMLAGSDNTYDIGAAGATRPRTIYARTSLIAQGGTNQVTLADGSLTQSSGTLVVVATAGVVQIRAGGTNQLEFNTNGAVQWTVEGTSGDLLTTVLNNIGDLANAARPANVYVGTSVVIGTTVTVTTSGISASAALAISAVGVASVNSTGAAINIGDGADAFAINIGTGPAARPITIGNVTGTTGINLNAGTNGVNVTGGLTAASLPVPVVISKTTGIDLTVVATTNLYTVPTGKTLTILEIVVKPTTATAVTIEPDAGVGIAAGEDDVFASQTLTGLTLTTERFKFPSGGVAVTGAAGEIVKLGVDVGATATALVADVLLIGYLE